MTRAVPLVTILLATRNGAAFLEEQLASLLSQTHKNWRLRVSDDGSCDTTLRILETFQDKIGVDRLTICQGPNRGATANFLSLLEGTGTQDGCLAFCDQDDVWLSEKLERAVSQIAGAPGPVLYACRAVIADSGLAGDQISALPMRALGLDHALAENVISGNAMVLDAKAAAMLRVALAGCLDREILEAGYHDWWVYQVIAASGGRVVVDAVPGLRYRQHDGNVVGSGHARGRWRSRVARALGGSYGRALRVQALGLLATQGVDRAAWQKAAALLHLRDVPIWRRPLLMKWLGIYRQKRGEDLALKLLMLFGRV
jgi:glycosyltransferase involved in cell wall biosynthesis